MMKYGKNVLTALAISALVTCFIGCQKKEGSVERAGKELEKAAEKTAEQIEEAGEKIQEATE
ncbi:MAG: hypothetical protein E3K37_14865 [Candidatus Kuenenia sp.]|nr:hypothetical protein [Candidatus Kuenenia hertensis]